MVITRGANQLASGLALGFFGLGLTALIGRPYETWNITGLNAGTGGGHGGRRRRDGVRPGRPADRLFSERFIHAEIYRARPDVNAVVHSHAPSVLPFGVTGTPLKPVSHMAGFLVRAVPVFEIRQ